MYKMNPANHSRDSRLRYDAPTVRVHPDSPWKPALTSTGCDETRYRVVAEVVVDAYMGTSLVEHRYTVVQRESRSCVELSDSSYRSSILIGNLVDAYHQDTLFDNSMTNHDHQGLWCTSCWADDMYHGDNGGVRIPTWMMGRYFSKLTNMQPCHCGVRFKSFVVDEIPAPPGTAYIFSTVKNAELQADVEAALAPYGIGTRNARASPLDPALLESILPAAMHPRRVEHILRNHGFEGLEAAF